MILVCRKGNSNSWVVTRMIISNWNSTDTMFGCSGTLGYFTTTFQLESSVMWNYCLQQNTKGCSLRSLVFFSWLVCEPCFCTVCCHWTYYRFIQFTFSCSRYKCRNYGQKTHGRHKVNMVFPTPIFSEHPHFFIGLENAILYLRWRPWVFCP
jgi:hypothetical protein